MMRSLRVDGITDIEKIGLAYFKNAGEAPKLAARLSIPAGSSGSAAPTARSSVLSSHH